MKYRKIILILLGSLLFMWLWFLTINCASREDLIQKSTLPTAVAAYKYDWIVIENTHLKSDEEFKAFVEKQVEGTNYIKITYDLVTRLHKTYLIRAWVFYKKINLARYFPKHDSGRRVRTDEQNKHPMTHNGVLGR